MSDNADPPVLMRGGRVLRPDGGTEVLDVLLAAGRVTGLGERLPVPAGGRVVEAGGHLVLPGLVDAHRHLWLGALSASTRDVTLPAYAEQVNEGFGNAFTSDDVYAGVLWGALQAINAGITTVADWAHNLGTPDDADADLRALADSGIRARLYFGGKPAPGGPGFVDLAREVHAGHFGSGAPGRVRFGLALRGPSIASPEENEREFALARELGVISIHAGMAGLPGAVELLHARGLLGADVNYVHANEFTAGEWDLVAGSGGSVSASPTVEMTMGLGTHPAVGPALARGIPVGLGADTVAYGPSDLFGEMRLALAAERSRHNAEAIGRGGMPAVLAHDHTVMLRIATRGGADVVGWEDVGTIEVGARADLISLDLSSPHLDGFGDPALSAFLGAGPGDVATVVIDGRVLKQDGVLDADLLGRARELVERSRTRLRGRR